MEVISEMYCVYLIWYLCFYCSHCFQGYPLSCPHYNCSYFVYINQLTGDCNQVSGDKNQVLEHCNQVSGDKNQLLEHCN